MSVCVMIPSRSRPANFIAAAHSVADTAPSAITIGYVDVNDPDYQAYLALELPPRTRLVTGVQLGPARSANLIAQQEPGHDWFGLITDDSIIETNGWDEYLASLSFAGGVGVVSPAHNLGPHVDMPFVSHAWIAALGWFSHPRLCHFCWPTLNALLAEVCGCLVHGDLRRFALHHEQRASYSFDATASDAVAFYEILLYEWPFLLDSLKDAQ